MPTGALLHTFPLETELLLRCARTALDAQEAAAIGACIERRPDWERVLAKAAWHGLAPLVYANLHAACPSAVPESVLDRMRAQALSVVEQSLLLTSELGKLLQRFEAAGIPVLPFKGPLLAVSAYGRLGLRSFDDVDLLVRREDALRAQDMLSAAGYRPFYRLTPFLRRVHLRKYTELAYGTAEHPVMADLHWGFVPPCYSFAPALDACWERLETIALNGTSMQSFNAQDTLRWLCLHGLKHDWERLGWVCDLSELIRSHATLPWDELMKAASQGGHLRMVLLGLRLARDLLGSRLPAAIAAALEADPRVARLAARVYHRLASGNEDRRRPFGISVIYPAAMERARDRWRYYFNVTLTPTGLEWAAVPLPAALYPLYYLIRPLRVLGKQGLDLLRRMHFVRGSKNT